MTAILHPGSGSQAASVAGAAEGSGSGAGTSAGLVFNIDPKWVGGGLIGIIGALLLYIWNDTTSDIAMLQKSVDELTKTVTRMEAKMETMVANQEDLKTVLRSSVEELKKDINNASSKSEILEIKKILEERN